MLIQNQTLNSYTNTIDHINKTNKKSNEHALGYMGGCRIQD